MTPKLSIGMPVLNGAPYMRRAIDSALGQSFGDFELIISDNASTDETAAIVDEYVRRDRRVRYHRQPIQLPVNENFRWVFGQARGDYYMWLAADDWWNDGFFERAVGVLDGDPGVVAVFSHFRIYDWTAGEYGARFYTVPAHGSARIRLLTRLIHPVPNAFYAMLRRSAVDLNDLPSVDYSDLLFLNAMAVKGDMAVISDDLFVAGQKRPSSAAAAANGASIRVGPYYRRTARLLRQHFRGLDRWF